MYVEVLAQFGFDDIIMMGILEAFLNFGIVVHVLPTNVSSGVWRWGCRCWFATASTVAGWPRIDINLFTNAKRLWDVVEVFFFVILMCFDMFPRDCEGMILFNNVNFSDDFAGWLYRMWYWFFGPVWEACYEWFVINVWGYLKCLRQDWVVDGECSKYVECYEMAVAFWKQCIVVSGDKTRYKFSCP